MSDSSSCSDSSIGFPGLLTILFIGLKLANYIDWSWWWVLSPVWISIAIVIVVFLIIGIVIGIIFIFEKILER